ncbi:hypothetical protein K2173_025766 [Erythroxylum novogranatense]|uniref:Uncharacterized protein n=1 Tax=Erythroxylum novogranatense TaxID=1862640 RepID=A0AAV8SHS1_9ROSI|nr:hypothetical protein K2173_025766 [Erythroxylum novogranatense]
MEFRIQRILTFLVLALVASDAASSPELYWKSVLPNTPMPNAVKDLLNPDSFMGPKPFSYQYAAAETRLQDIDDVFGHYGAA